MKSGLLLLALSAILFAFSGNTAAAELEAQVASAWYADWHRQQVPLDEVPWNKYTRMTYAFALTTPDPGLLDNSSLIGLKDFVSAARNNRVKPMVSIGGWTGSRFFSTAVGSEKNRTAFVKAVTSLAESYALDGVDFDWEYPNHDGAGCNLRGPKDTENFQAFLKALRGDDLGKNLIVTVAATNPWLGENGNPVTDVSGFVEVLDYVAIMNYDVWGSWSEFVGPNSPLSDDCGPHPRSGSALSSVNAWVKAGMPKDKIVLAVPSYGHSYRVTNTSAIAEDGSLASFPLFDKNDQPSGDEWDGKPGELVCGIPTTKPGGIFQFLKMISLGYIDKNGNPLPGLKSRFDNCSKTPFIFDPKTNIMISYDDPQSMHAKGEFIKAQKLRGFSLWEVGGDSDAKLVDAIRSALFT